MKNILLSLVLCCTAPIALHAMHVKGKRNFIPRKMNQRAIIAKPPVLHAQKQKVGKAKSTSETEIDTLLQVLVVCTLSKNL
jgi:hypothetical protein